MANTVDISSLQESAIRLQKDLKLLPFFIFKEVLGGHGITMWPGIQNKHVLTTFLRKQGILEPYVAGAVNNKNVGKAVEEELEVYLGYASVKDNIQNYKTISIGPDVLLGKNKSKNHPWQQVMLSSIVKTFGEDILDALFPAARDVEDLSPLGVFDGYDTIIDAKILSGAIAEGENNYYETDAFTNENTYEQLLEFWRSRHPHLKKANTLLLVPDHIGNYYDDNFFTVHKYRAEKDDYKRTLLEGSEGRCRIVRSNIMGTGDRIMLIVNGLLHFGFDTNGDESFVQVRTPYEDPNMIQFWIQSSMGCRIASVHEKLFSVNNGTPTAVQLSGDYS